MPIKCSWDAKTDQRQDIKALNIEGRVYDPTSVLLSVLGIPKQTREKMKALTTERASEE